MQLSHWTVHQISVTEGLHTNPCTILLLVLLQLGHTDERMRRGGNNLWLGMDAVGQRLVMARKHKVEVVCTLTPRRLGQLIKLLNRQLLRTMCGAWW